MIQKPQCKYSLEERVKMIKEQKAREREEILDSLSTKKIIRLMSNYMKLEDEKSTPKQKMKAQEQINKIWSSTKKEGKTNDRRFKP